MNLLHLLLVFAFFEKNKANQHENRPVTIAVVEYKPIRNGTLAERILANSDEYIRLLHSVNDTNLDMIIFPEDTLRNNPRTAVELTLLDNPCKSLDYPNFIKNLSCAARSTSSYLVINLVEKIKCNSTNQSRNCKKYGFLFYNTDIVFDRSGKILVKYHKYNLFGEIELDKPSPERIVFDTDFGIKFGIFTCFDILFKNPSQDLLKQRPDAIIFPSMWFSQLPFLTALQTQQMWAHAHNIRFFSSGANDPSVGSGGTGVFYGKEGAMVDGINAKGGSQVFLYKFINGETPDFNPQKPMPWQNPDDLGKEMDGFLLSQDPSLQKYNSIVLDTTKEDFNEELCYKDLCCDFTIKTTSTSDETTKNSYTYHLVAFSGTRTFSHVYNGGIEICGIIACLNSSLSSCGRRFPNYEDINWPITFEKISIKAIFEKTEEKTQFPNSLLSSIRPINASQTIWEEEETAIDGKIAIKRSFSLKMPQNRLLTFAIFGRDFNKDFPSTIPRNEDAGISSVYVSWFLLSVAITLSFL